MFSGEFRHSLDEKGRLIMPSRFREELGDTFVLTRGFDHCLWCFSPEAWREMEARFRGLSFMQSNVRAFLRWFFSGATECELDRQGRFVVPASLREYARIQREVVIIGAFRQVEIWSRERWEEYDRRTEGQVEQVAEEIGALEF